MTTVFKLVQGAVETNLHDQSTTYLLDYTPLVGEKYGRDIPDEENIVTEQCTIMVMGANQAALMTTRSNIVNVLRSAKEAQENRSLNKVYITFQPNGAANAWRSEILEATIVNEENVHDNSWNIKKVELTIIWTRRNYWDGAYTAVPLTNSNGTDITTGLTIYNHDDAGAGHDNYVQINDEDVEGDLPAACAIGITNTYASADELGYVWVGHNYSDVTQVHIWEAEDAAGGTPTASGSSSGGEYSDLSLPTGTENELLTWTVSANFMERYKERTFKALVRFETAAYTNIPFVWFRIRIKESGKAMLWQSNRFRPSADYGLAIRDLATFRMPPWSGTTAGLAALDLVLTGYQTTGGSLALPIDFLALLPCDSFRYLEPRMEVLNTERIFDDGLNDGLFVDNGALGNRRAAVVTAGNMILLEPGKDQYLRFLMHANTGNTAEIARTASIVVYYRPRRLTI